MSDDVPVIIAHETASRRIVFASAASEVQMQQYAAAGWAVNVTPDFKSARALNLAKVPASPGAAHGADMLSVEGANLSAGLEILRATLPPVAKFNLAFAAPAIDGTALVGDLARLGYVVLAALWRDDNVYRIRSLCRLEPVAALQPPDWVRLNLIACRDSRRAEAILRIGRVHAAQEQRVADLRIGEAVRNDHIARLEDAVQVLQHRVESRS